MIRLYINFIRTIRNTELRGTVSYATLITAQPNHYHCKNYNKHTVYGIISFLSDPLSIEKELALPRCVRCDYFASLAVLRVIIVDKKNSKEMCVFRIYCNHCLLKDTSDAF